MNSTQDFEPQQTEAAQRLEAEAAEKLTIPVIEEQVQIGRQVVETGRIRITKSVTEQPEAVAIPLLHEEVSVERVAVNQYVDQAPTVRHEGDTTIIPVVREVLVKRLFVVEELHVTKRQLETLETQQVMLRKEEVSVERLTPDAATNSPLDHS